ncbi:DUF4190 domain-containing protein [Couchioplanes caeruleus]|uniref:DUF4190 domain-containing protein n=2 Tax=Couchioplanes caeruleus TaxID=56438 RepID=A0A1K0GEL7_9ACTN|nr:DUF4190 domain-containing protein [Couchioplanes caeruleus]OJF15682.1 hypothetical protein BG844_02825 [Couchioplanes caeruleus subsp. caeruleus]ROP31810.1 uncharacterized protein DUF4190 [Couchioplanes caeruleus]
MTYPPTPAPDGSQPPPHDPLIQAYQPLPPYGSPQGYAPPQAYQVPAAQDPYAPGAPAPYGYAAGQQVPYDYGYAGSPYGYSQYPPGPRPTDGMAIASLVVSCVSIVGLCGFWLGGILGVVGAILGHVARRRIRQSGANGGGMALAGIIVGWVVTAIALTVGVVVGVLIANDPSSTTF